MHCSPTNPKMVQHDMIFGGLVMSTKCVTRADGRSMFQLRDIL